MGSTSSSALSSQQIDDITKKLHNHFEYGLALRLDKKHLYDTMVTECNKLLIAEGVASEDGFIKLFDEELKKKLDAVPDSKPRSRSNSANISTKVPVPAPAPIPISEKRNKAPVKATPRRRSYDVPPPAASSTVDKRPITRGSTDALPAIAHSTPRPTTGGENGPTVTPVPAQRSNSFTGELRPLPGIVRIDDKHSESLFGATEKHLDASPPPAAVYVDSWDSVTQQPYCTLCQMAFKSVNFLERHRNYSELHQRNLTERNELEKQKHDQSIKDSLPAQKLVLPPLSPAPHKHFAPAQLEGTHYKLLYCGCKLFWRTQKTIEFEFYHHILPHTIEVLAFDYDKHLELNRLYLDYTSIADLVEESVQHRLNNDLDELHEEEVRRLQITSYVLARLQQDCVEFASINSPGQPKRRQSTIPVFKVAFATLSGDNPPSPLLDTPPTALIPVSVTRRRRSSAEEIDSTMKDLDKDRAAMLQATEKAEKVAQLVFSTATIIRTNSSHAKWYDKLNPVRKRWIRAIRRVIRSIKKKEMVEYLKKLYPRGIKSAKSRVTTKQQARAELMSNEL